ncbi:MAG TPA: hypothetical protein VJ440_07160, partial [Candidatus Brocadiaceae bacterium]|nr:hypothetical protein [Candidatus Brocadiaceae bacterium]
KGGQTQPNRISSTAPKGRNTIAQGNALGLALLAQQALKGRYWGQNNGSFGITPFRGLLVFPCPQGVALG